MIPKSDGGQRELGIPTVLDRLIQQALLQVLQPLIDPSFTDWESPDSPDLKLSNRPVRTRTPGGVAGAPPVMEAPYADGASSRVVAPGRRVRNEGRTMAMSRAGP
jgi:hypothetical protein